MSHFSIQGEEHSFPLCQHASTEEYASFLRGYTTQEKYVRRLLVHRERFVETYPDLREWFAAPLPERIGRLYGEKHDCPSYQISYKARSYLVFLVLRGYATLDWDWLLAIGRLTNWGMLDHLGLDLGIPKLVEDAVTLGYDHATASHSFGWSMLRIFLHTAQPRTESVSYAQLTEAVEAVYRFGERPDMALFHGSAERYQQVRKFYTASLYLLHVVLYHRGQLIVEPHRVLPDLRPRTSIRPRMEAVVERYLVYRRLTDRPSTIEHLDLSTHRFIAWLAQVHPQVETFAQVTRDLLMEYAEVLNTMISPSSGRPFATVTKRCELSNLSVFFQDTARWGWEDVPGRPLLQRIPRYIPDNELPRIMSAIRELECPYQRTALLIARWSGARRGEIRRLSLDCLDTYPDSTYRLRIPAGKTKRERLIPLNDEAAEAIRQLQKLRLGERGFRDEQTGIMTRYLFVRRGKLLSCAWLFETALRTACTHAGLVTTDGKATITAHRFRHTVGRQLAERGAKLHTIMSVLGHSNATMSMIYAQIGDPEVRKDYQAVLGPGATIAGPAASVLLAGELSTSAITWLRTNYLKTELELGRCLRLPQEGPCECDLYLSCAKFVTTPEYAPRLRRRRRIELELIEDAITRGWQREVERHQCTIRRLEQLLTDLQEPIEGSEATD
jgi:integrase